MADTYEPREVEPDAWKRWIRQGWELSLRRRGLWLLQALVALVLSTLCVVILTSLPSNPIVLVLALLTLFPLAGSYLLAQGQLLAAHADGLLGSTEYRKAALSLAPVTFTRRMVLRRPDLTTLALVASYTLMMFILQGPIDRLPTPALDFSALGRSALTLFNIASLLGFGLTFVGLWTNTILAMRARTHPQTFLHQILLKLPWETTEVLAVVNFRRNARPLTRFTQLAQLLFFVLALSVGASVVIASPVLASAVLVASLLTLNVVSSGHYVAWREIYMGRRENTPVRQTSPAPAQRAEPVTAP